MKIQSLSAYVTATAGTPKRVTAGETVPGAIRQARLIMFQSRPANTAVIYIGNKSDFSKTTGDGVVAVIGFGTSAPSVTIGTAEGKGNLDVSDYYMDPDVSDEGLSISWNHY